MQYYIKDTFLVAFLFCCSSIYLTAQDYSQDLPCATDIEIQKLYTQRPELHQEVIQKRQELIKEEKDNLNSSLLKTPSIRTIPIVFHVVHQCGDEKINPAQIEAALVDLNADFSATNADGLQPGDPFYEDQAATNFRFELAELDPDGNATRGITYTESPLTQDGAAFGDAIKKMINWPRETYLNVWVIKHLSNASGYAFYPEVVDEEADAFRDGIIIRYDYLGTTGASSVDIHGRRHILSHEVGHWLGLQHAWGDAGINSESAFTPVGHPDNCMNDDKITDTPETIGNNSIIYPNGLTCADLFNTCNDNGAYDGQTNCANSNDPPDNGFNIMDYGAEIMFTFGQATRMLFYGNSTFSDRHLIGTNPILTFIADNVPTLHFDNYFFIESDDDDGSIYNEINLSLSQGNFNHSSLEYPNGNGLVEVENLPIGYTLQIVRDPNDYTKATMYLIGNAMDHTNINDVAGLNIQFNNGAFENVNHSDLNNTTLHNLKIDFKDFGPIYHRFTLNNGDNPVCTQNIELAYEGFYLDFSGYLVVTYVQGAFYMLNESAIKVEVLCNPNTSNLAFIPEDSNIASIANNYTFRQLTRNQDEPNSVVIHNNNYTALAGNTGYVGIRITNEGCFNKTMYGWLRVEIPEDGSQVCMIDAFYNTETALTTQTTASITEVNCASYTIKTNPFFSIESVAVEGTLFEDISTNTNSQFTFDEGAAYPVEFIQDGNGDPDLNNGLYRTYWGAWIDFNDDGFYDIDELVFNELNIFSAITGADITNSNGVIGTVDSLRIPDNANPGEHTMLLIESLRNYNDTLIATYSFDPCNSLEYGDIKYYQITIDGDVACQAYKLYDDTDILPETTQVADYVEMQGVTITDGQNITVQAGNHIDLLPSDSNAPTEIELGATFCADIAPCTPMSNKVIREEILEESQAITEEAQIQLKVYPNPFSNEFNLQYTISKETPVTIKIYDSTGKLKQIVMEEILHYPNDYTHNVDTHNLENGIYIINIITQYEQQSQELIKL